MATRRATSARDARGGARLKHDAQTKRSAMHCNNGANAKKDEHPTTPRQPRTSTSRSYRPTTNRDTHDTNTQRLAIGPTNEQARRRTRSKLKRRCKQRPTRRNAEARRVHAKSHNPTQEQPQAKHHRREDEYPAVCSTIKTARRQCIAHVFNSCAREVDISCAVTEGISPNNL